MGLELAKEGRDSSSAATLLDRPLSPGGIGGPSDPENGQLCVGKRSNGNGNERPNLQIRCRCGVLMCDSISASQSTDGKRKMDGGEHFDQYLPNYVANPTAVGFLSKRLSLVKPGRVLCYADDAGGNVLFLSWKLCV